MSLDGVHVRGATLFDAEAIAALVTQLGYPTAATDMHGRLEHLLPHPDRTMVVAETAQGIVGMAAAQVGPALEFNGIYGRIDGLVVDARWRGRGLGRLLMVHVEEWCKARGAHSLTLTSGHHRPDAHKFYTSIGYNATGLRFIKQL